MTRPHLLTARHAGRYRIHLTYENGVEGTVDLESELWGEMFEPLKDVERFKAFRVDANLDTVVWPSGADFAPEFLYERVSRNAG